MAAGPVPHPRTPVSSSTLSTITLLLVLMFSVNADTVMATDRAQHNGHEPTESHARLDLPSMHLQLSSITQQQPSKYTSWRTSQSTTVNPSEPRRNDEAAHEQIDATIMPLLQQSHSPSPQTQLQDSPLPSHAYSKPSCTDDDVDDLDFNNGSSQQHDSLQSLAPCVSAPRVFSVSSMQKARTNSPKCY